MGNTTEVTSWVDTHDEVASQLGEHATTGAAWELGRSLEIVVLLGDV
jgi:hypothetical protein